MVVEAGADAATTAATVEAVIKNELRQIAAPHQRVAEVAELRHSIGAVVAG